MNVGLMSGLGVLWFRYEYECQSHIQYALYSHTVHLGTLFIRYDRLDCTFDHVSHVEALSHLLLLLLLPEPVAPALSLLSLWRSSRIRLNASVLTKSTEL